MTTGGSDAMTKLAGDRYIVISSDGHAGAQLHDYRAYLEAKYLDIQRHIPG
jgi:hypothetical protein